LLSRDGTKFLFVRNLAATDALFVANVDGSGLRQLAEGRFVADRGVSLSTVARREFADELRISRG
jgi:hypothetical protein